MILEAHGQSVLLDPDDYSGGGQGSFVGASGTDRISSRWDHSLGYFSHIKFKGTRSWRKIMHKVRQGQTGRLCKYGRGQELDSLIISAKGRVHKDGV